MTEEGKGEYEGEKKNGEERDEGEREAGKCTPPSQGGCRTTETRTSKQRQVGVDGWEGTERHFKQMYR